MTPEQKTDRVLSIVNELRKEFDRAEFVSMVNFIWDGLSGAQDTAMKATDIAHGGTHANPIP
jgi:hypothetical protein